MSSVTYLRLEGTSEALKSVGKGYLYGCPALHMDESLHGWVSRVAAHFAWSESQVMLHHGWSGAVWDADFAMRRSDPEYSAAISGLDFQRYLHVLRQGYLYTRMLHECCFMPTPGLARYALCPVCLATDATPYVRLRWRNSMNLLCDIHQVRLISSCPKCHENLRYEYRQCRDLPYRTRARSICLCNQCGFDLAESPIDNPPQEVAQRLLRYQHGLEAAMMSGYVRHANLGTISVKKWTECFLQRRQTRQQCYLDANEWDEFSGVDWRKVMGEHIEAFRAWRGMTTAFHECIRHS